MFNFLKERALKFYMNTNPTINRIAEVLEVKLEKGRINLTVKLKGEAESVSVSLNYVFEGSELRITDVKANKEWVNGLAYLFKDHYSRIDLNKYGKVMDIVKHLF